MQQVISKMPSRVRGERQYWSNQKNEFMLDGALTEILKVSKSVREEACGVETSKRHILSSVRHGVHMNPAYWRDARERLLPYGELFAKDPTMSIAKDFLDQVTHTIETQLTFEPAEPAEKIQQPGPPSPR